MHREPQPVKLHTIAPMYRYAAPQKGRYREHWQWSVEAIGSADPAVDAELIQLYPALLAPARDRAGRAARCNSIGDAACRPAYVERARGVARRTTRDAARRRGAAQAAHEPAAGLRRQEPRPAGGARRRPADRRVALRPLPRAPGGGARLPRRLRRRLHARARRSCAGSTTTRRTTFEFVHAELGLSICGGGRYDGLVEEIGGPPTPGIGFGAGIDRLALAARGRGRRPRAARPRGLLRPRRRPTRGALLALLAALRARRASPATSTTPAARSRAS